MRYEAQFPGKYRAVDGATHEIEIVEYPDKGPPRVVCRCAQRDMWWIIEALRAAARPL